MEMEKYMFNEGELKNTVSMSNVFISLGDWLRRSHVEIFGSAFLNLEDFILCTSSSGSLTE